MNQQVTAIEGIKYNGEYITNANLTRYNIFPISYNFAFHEIAPRINSETDKIGYYTAEKDGKWGALDAEFQVVIPFLYKSLAIDEDDIFLIQDFDDYYGFINVKANTYIQPQFDDAAPSTCGRTLYMDPETRLYGYLNAVGKIIIKPRFTYAYQFYNDVAAVTQDDPITGEGQSLSIDRYGRECVPIDAKEFAKEKKEDEEFFDNYKNAIYRKRFEQMNKVTGYLETGFLDEDGDVAIRAIYSDAEDFIDNRACVAKRFTDLRILELANIRNSKLVRKQFKGIMNNVNKPFIVIYKKRVKESLANFCSVEKQSVIDPYGNYLTNGIYHYSDTDQKTNHYTHFIYSNSKYKLINPTRAYGLIIDDKPKPVWFDSELEKDEYLNKIINNEPVKKKTLTMNYQLHS